jgi:hypothetical protein
LFTATTPNPAGHHGRRGFLIVRLAGRAVPEGTDNREAKAERE